MDQCYTKVQNPEVKSTTVQSLGHLQHVHVCAEIELAMCCVCACGFIGSEGASYGARLDVIMLW